MMLYVPFLNTGAFYFFSPRHAPRLISVQNAKGGKKCKRQVIVIGAEVIGTFLTFPQDRTGLRMDYTGGIYIEIGLI